LICLMFHCFIGWPAAVLWWLVVITVTYFYVMNLLLEVTQPSHTKYVKVDWYSPSLRVSLNHHHSH
jgi:hypothetical protein